MKTEVIENGLKVNSVSIQKERTGVYVLNIETDIKYPKYYIVCHGRFRDNPLKFEICLSDPDNKKMKARITLIASSILDEAMLSKTHRSVLDVRYGVQFLFVLYGVKEFPLKNLFGG